MWFDKGALEKARDEENPNLNWMDFDLWKDPEKFQVSAHHLTCPRDQRIMAAIDYGETGVWVNTCLTCHGIWLDSGAFQCLLEALENEMASTPESEYVIDSLREAGRLVTGREGFASEWKDFTTVLRLMQFRLLAENPGLRDALIVLSNSTPFK
jgi:Zn-finger nucleic acid-binding protein